MTSLDRAKLTFAAMGVAIWFYGTRVENSNLRLLGIAVLALAVLLRFFRRPRDRP
jgi:hypothetical protein